MEENMLAHTHDLHHVRQPLQLSQRLSDCGFKRQLHDSLLLRLIGDFGLQLSPCASLSLCFVSQLSQSSASSA
jgi:hypothetical protein